MFTQLKLNNFKSWESADISFGRITGLYGTNSSGKTSLLQFLLLLKQTKDASDRNIALDLNGGPYVKLGTMTEAIFRHNKRRRLFYEVGVKLDEELTISDATRNRKAKLLRSDELAIRADVGLQGRASKGNGLTYRFGKAEFSLTQFPSEPSKFQLDCHGLGGFKFIRNRGRAWNLPGPVKSYQFPDQARTYYQNASFLSDLEYAFEQQLDRLYYLGPLREYPQRDYRWAGSMPAHVGTRGETAIDAILAAQETGETYNLKPKAPKMKFPEMVAHWLKKMGLIHKFRLVEVGEGSNLWQVKVKRNKNSSEVLLPDVGFGVLQVLPVITLLYYVPEGSTVLLEKPEIHLHPLAQTELAELIINVAMHRNVQIILESHSEHLLLRLQRCIAEGEKISSDDVKLFFCKAPNGASNGASTLEELRLDPLGNIENWPDRFMGDAFTETAKAALARIERRKTAA